MSVNSTSGDPSAAANGAVVWPDGGPDGGVDDVSGIPNARLVGMERTVNIRLRDSNGNGGLPGQLHALNTAVGTSTKLYGDMRKL